MTLSALSFVYNEEKGIERALQSIKPFTNEIIIFDLESTDNTFDICKKYTDNVYRMPYMLCGDAYKQELVYRSTGDWLLWFYGDEVFPEYTAKSFEKFMGVGKWNAFAFMRHEYMDNIRLNFKRDEELVEYGTSQSPNYQVRLIKKESKVFYTELVHAEIHGQYNNCSLPSEYYMEHRKTSQDQEFDNIRLYIWYKHLIFKYGNTKVEPYKTYIDSYKKIVADSEDANLKGIRKIHLAEEFWYDWKSFVTVPRITLDEFKNKTGFSYQEYLENVKLNNNVKTFEVNYKVKDKAVVASKEGGL